MRPPGLTSGAARSSASACSLQPLGERARPHPPFGVRIAPPGAGAGAGRIDQHEVGAAGEIGERVLLAARRAHLHVARAGALEPLVDRRKPALVGVGRVDLARGSPSSAASASVLPPAPAHRSTTCSPGFAPASSAASCEPSSWISIRPLRNAGSAWIAGLLASGAEHDAQAAAATSASAAHRGRRAPPRLRRASP